MPKLKSLKLRSEGFSIINHFSHLPIIGHVRELLTNSDKTRVIPAFEENTQKFFYSRFLSSHRHDQILHTQKIKMSSKLRYIYLIDGNRTCAHEVQNEVGMS
jgi:hypothetical protein